MNTCISDEQTIINIQGIRYVTWGESSHFSRVDSNKPWYVTVTYKGNHQSFSYRTETEAKSLFDKIRKAMDKDA